MVELGDKVKCKVTGFKGIVTAVAKCLTGCDRAEVRPDKLTKDGAMLESYWVDVAALEIIKKQAIKPKSVQDPATNKKGGPPTRSTLR